MNRKIVALSLLIMAPQIVAPPGLADPAALSPSQPADSRELPSFMVPIPADAAEAYWAPDSRHLIAQTRDPDAVKTLTGGNGALTWIFSDDGKMDIWVLKTDGTGEFQVTRTDEWQEGAPFFLPDNETIIFRAWRRADYKKGKLTPMTIFTIRRDGTDWRRHTFDEGMNWHPTPAPDGRHYVYVKAMDEQNWEIYLGDLAGGEHRRLTYSDKIDILAHISPDGKKMNWGRATGERFMSKIRTFVMDVSSLNLGKENYVPFDPSWGQKMKAQ